MRSRRASPTSSTSSKSMGFANYFLVVWDFIRFAREQGILVGPGRGSSAGSIVTYSLGITALDPLEYDLIFERFLNPSRISMPDIDIDFADDRRDEVIDYVVSKYGDDRVAQIVTFGTLAAKAAVRDVGRAMGRSFAETDRVAKLIPVGPGITIDGALTKVPELRHHLRERRRGSRADRRGAQSRRNLTSRLDACRRGRHLARPPRAARPIAAGGGKSEGDITTQFPMAQLEELGLLKMDFLGLRTLTVLGKAGSSSRTLVTTYPLRPSRSTMPSPTNCCAAAKRPVFFSLRAASTSRMTVEVAPASSTTSSR